MHEHNEPGNGAVLHAAGRHPDAACHLFQAPLSDLIEALSANNLLAVSLPQSGATLGLGPHPAMVAYGALVNAIRAGLEAGLEDGLEDGLEADAEAVAP